jgi:uncharacterized protein YjgD (DUF1641 family)
MAEPIPLTLAPRDPRERLHHRLENAPQEHVEALLAMYEVLQGLHDRGVLDLVRGALGSSDQVLEILVEAGNAPEVIRGMRNFIILTRLFGTLDPEMLEALARVVPETLALAKTEKPLGLVSLLQKLRSEDTRRVLTAMTGVLEALGKDMGPAQKP